MLTFAQKLETSAFAFVLEIICYRKRRNECPSLLQKSSYLYNAKYYFKLLFNPHLWGCFSYISDKRMSLHYLCLFVVLRVQYHATVKGLKLVLWLLNSKSASNMDTEHMLTMEGLHLSLGEEGRTGTTENS